MKTIEYRNLALECQACRYLLDHPSSAALVEADWFSAIPLQYVVLAIKKARVVLTTTALYQAVKLMKDVDRELLPVVKQYIEKIDDADLVTNDKSFHFIVSQLVELFETRSFSSGLEQVVEDMKRGTSTIEEIKGKTSLLTKRIRVSDRSTSGDWIGDYDLRLEVMKSKLVEDDANGNRGIPTGIVYFDQMIGGLMRGEFGVIAGKPGIGKTAAMIDFGAHAYLSGYNVLFCSGEMPKYDIQTRFDAHFAGVPSGKYRSGELSKEERSRWAKTIEQYKLSQKNFLHVTAFSRGFTADNLEAELVKVEDEWQEAVDLILVDYLNIMSPNKAGKGSSRDWDSQADAVWDLKGLIADHNGGIRCWTGGQIKDEAFELPRLELDHLKYARAISETAPIVVGLVRTRDDVMEERLQFQVLKMRNAPPIEKVIYLHPNLSLMRLHERLMEKKDLLELEPSTGAYQEPEKKKLYKPRPK